MKVKFTKSKVADCIAEARAAGGDRFEWSDTVQQGLVLRVGPKSAVWLFVSTQDSKKKRLILGDAPTLPFDEARTLAARARDKQRQGLAVDVNWVMDERSPRSSEPKIRTTWTYDEARTEFLAFKSDSVSEATLADYRKVLDHRALKRFERRYVADITDAELSAVVYEIRNTGYAAQAKAVRGRLAALWKWLHESRNRAASGIVASMAIDRLPKAAIRTASEGRAAPLSPIWHVPKKPGRRLPVARTPNPTEVGAALKRAMAGELEPASAAIALLIMTAQRRTTVAKGRLEDVDLSRKRWFIPPSSLKTGKRRESPEVHLLPWPEKVEVAEEGEYLFPAKRKRYAGRPKTHMAPDTITHAMSDHGVGFTPHDVRRSFTTLMRMKGFTKGDARLVLDHKEGGGTVIDEHYDGFRDLPLKTHMMNLWWDHLEGRRSVSVAEWRAALGLR